MAASNLIDLLTFYTSFSAPRDTRADYEQGEQDGFREFPPSDQTGPSPHELDLISQGRADLSRYRAAIANEQSASAAFTAQQKQMRLEQYESERRDIASRYDRELEAVNYRIGPVSRRAQAEDLALFEVEQTYDSLARSENREPVLHFIWPNRFGLTSYIAILAFLAVAELAINRSAFETMLNTSAVQAYGVAALFGVSTIFLAHTLGLFVRQARARAKKGEKVRLWLSAPAIVILIVGMFYEMSVIRQGQLFREGIQQVAEAGVGLLPKDFASTGAKAAGFAANAASNALGLTSPLQLLKVNALLLFLLNLSVFVTGALLSYFRHDPHPDFERMWRERETARAKVAQRHAQYDEEIAGINEDYRRRHGNLTAKSDRLQREIEQEQIHMGSHKERTKIGIDKVVNVVTQRVLAYQSGNNRNRDTSPPPYFGEATISLVRRLINGSRDDDFFEKNGQPFLGGQDLSTVFDAE